jgi:predicted negative regulator of RcsB-dependent stress response
LRKIKIPIDFTGKNRHYLARNMTEQSTDPIPLGEILQGPSPFEQFLERNQKLIAVAAVAVGLGIGGFMVYRTIAADTATAAGAALSQAKDIADLEKVKTEYANTPSAVTAALQISEKQWANNQQDESIVTLREIVEKFPQHPAHLIAQNALGHRLLEQGKTGDAELAFQAVIDSPSGAFLAPMAIISLGDIASKGGDKAKAEELYKKVGDKYKESTFTTLAIDRIKFLNFVAPNEIEAPPVVSSPPASITQPDLAPAPANPNGNPLLETLNQSTSKQDDASEKEGASLPPKSATESDLGEEVEEESLPDKQ